MIGDINIILSKVKVSASHPEAFITLSCLLISIYRGTHSGGLLSLVLCICTKHGKEHLTTNFFSLESEHFLKKRLQEMLSVTENNRIIPAIHKVSNHPVSVTDNILL